jgi:Domain of unknown function (DUF4304)
MKETHKILVAKLKPLFKKYKYLKGSESSWYKPHFGFSTMIELQKSQWSDDIYLNYYFLVHQATIKPKKSDPYITGRISGLDIGMSEDNFNSAMELSSGDIGLKTNEISVIVESVIKLISTVSNINKLKNFIETRKFETLQNCQIDALTHNGIRKSLGLE